MSWNEVGKSDRSSANGRFVQHEDGKTTRLRILDEEPFITRAHKVSQLVKRGDKTEEVFRTVPATDNPDESFILKHNPERYPEQRQFNMRCHEFKTVDGKHVVDGELKILQGGNAIFNVLKQLYDENGSLTQFDITITRRGEKRDTEYVVTAVPFPLKGEFSVAERIAAMKADATLAWENVFPKVTGEMQRKIISEAGFDIAYDPAAAIASKMTLDEAGKTKFTFGKYKDKPIGEIMVIDAGYVSWAAEKVNSNDTVAAACRVMCGQAGAIAAAQAPVQQQLPASTAASSRTLSRLEQAEAAAAAEQANSNVDRKVELVEKIGDYFEQDPRFADIPVMVGLIKKHSDGRCTRVKDMTVPQLEHLLNEVSKPAE